MNAAKTKQLIFTENNGQSFRPQNYQEGKRNMKAVSTLFAVIQA